MSPLDICIWTTEIFLFLVVVPVISVLIGIILTDIVFGIYDKLTK